MLLILITAISLGVFLFYALPDPSSEHVEPANEQSSEDITEEDTTEEPVEEEEASISQNIQDGVRDVFDALNFFQKDTHIVAIGDSLTQGVGDETGNEGMWGFWKID